MRPLIFYQVQRVPVPHRWMPMVLHVHWVVQGWGSGKPSWLHPQRKEILASIKEPFPECFFSALSGGWGWGHTGFPQRLMGALFSYSVFSLLSLSLHCLLRGVTLCIQVLPQLPQDRLGGSKAHSDGELE